MPHSLSQPAPLERVRVSVARFLFCNASLPTKLAIRLVPENHPWRFLVESTCDDLRQMTYATLRERHGVVGGQVRAKVSEPSRLVWPAAKAALAVYVLIDLLSARVDGPIHWIAQVDDAVRLFERLGF